MFLASLFEIYIVRHVDLVLMRVVVSCKLRIWEASFFPCSVVYMSKAQDPNSDGEVMFKLDFDEGYWGAMHAEDILWGLVRDAL